jgi:hypothetical protein
MKSAWRRRITDVDAESRMLLQHATKQGSLSALYMSGPFEDALNLL